MSLVAFASGIVLGTGCTPQERRELAPALPAITEAACVVLRALGASSDVLEICATVDELAPYVPDIISERKRRHEAPQTFGLAVKLSPARSLRPSRRCVGWVELAWSKDDGGRGEPGPRDGGGTAHGP